MELLDGRIHIHPRRQLYADKVVLWPNPTKYQFYQLNGMWHRIPLKVYLYALKVVRRRPDINCLEISMHDLLNETTRKALNDLLNMKDRAWSVWLYVPTDAPSDRSRLKRALTVLQNVQYLSLLQNPHCDMNHNILNSLPLFFQLKCLDLRCWRVQPKDMIEFFDKYSFASRVQGFSLCNNRSDNFSGPLFSGKVTSHIHTLDLCFRNFSVHDITLLVAGLRELPSLETLHVDFDEVHDTYLEPLRLLVSWLGSPRCPVTDLSFAQNPADQLQWFLSTLLPVMPRLKTIRLPNYRRSRAPGLHHWIFPVLLETPMLETIVLRVFNIDKETCNRIFSFQVNNRTRMFAVQLHGRPSESPHEGPQKIHHVSRVHQILRNFRNSKDHVAFPLSAWSIVLEQLGSAFDSFSVDVHAIGVNARFSIIQELLERPHVLLRR